MLKRGFEVSIIAPVDEYIEYKNRFPTVKHYALRSLSRNSTNPFRDILLIAEFYRKYKRIKPDVILHYTHKPNIFGTIAARILKIPSISVVTGLGYAFIHDNIVNTITKTLYQLIGKRADRIIFENQDDRQFFIDNRIVNEEKAIAVKGCGVDINHFHPYPNGQIKKTITFTFLGRLLYDKGILEFVSAAKILNKEYDNLRFWVIGELDDDNPATVKEDDVLEWVNNDIIQYFGFVRDVRKLISQSDCIVLPSYREGLPRIVIEAMAMAKPIITTDVPGCRETVDHGSNGYLIKAQQVEPLVSSIKDFLELSYEERHKMGEMGRLKAEKEFDDKKVANQICDIIEDVIF